MAKGRRQGGRAAAIVVAAAMMTAMTGLYGALLVRNYNGVVPYCTVFEREVTGA